MNGAWLLKPSASDWWPYVLLWVPADKTEPIELVHLSRITPRRIQRAKRKITRLLLKRSAARQIIQDFNKTGGKP